MIDEKKLIECMDERFNKIKGNVPDNLAEGFVQMEKLIKEQPKVGEWIPRSEEFPKESGYYLACIYNSYFDDFDFRKTWFAHKDDYDIEESEWRELYDFEVVTAWMPLPEPYKED